MTTMRPQSDVDRALSLVSRGHTPTEVARIALIPRETVREWSYGRSLRQKRSAGSSCSYDQHVSELEYTAYGYLLGIYLGDGCISERPRGVSKLRLTLGSMYPQIIDGSAAAIEAVSGRRANVLQRRDGRCVEVSAYWKHWCCVFLSMARAESVCVRSRSPIGSARSSWRIRGHCSAAGAQRRLQDRRDGA